MINDVPIPVGTLYRLPVGQFVILSTHPHGTGGIQNNSKKLYGDILILFLEIYSDPIWGTNTAKVLVGGEVGAPLSAGEIWGTNTAKVLVGGEVGYVSLIGLKKVEQ